MSIYRYFNILYRLIQRIYFAIYIFVVVALLHSCCCRLWCFKKNDFIWTTKLNSSSHKNCDIQFWWFFFSSFLYHTHSHVFFDTGAAGHINEYQPPPPAETGMWYIRCHLTLRILLFRLRYYIVVVVLYRYIWESETWW